MNGRNALIAGTLLVVVMIVGTFSWQNRKLANGNLERLQSERTLLDKIAALEKSQNELAEKNLLTEQEIQLVNQVINGRIMELNMGGDNLFKNNQLLRDQLTDLRSELESYRNRVSDLYAKAGYLCHIEVDGNSTSNVDQKMKWFLSGAVIERNDKHYILTAGHLHNSNRDITKVTIKYDFGKATQEAEVWGYDHNYDVMLLKFKDQNFTYTGPVAKIGDGDVKSMPIGTEVVALGSPNRIPFHLTVGYIGNHLRDSPTTRDLIFHDATINPGNSGGPLLNNKGEVVGINVMVRFDPTNPAFTSIPIAVSIHSILEIIGELERGNKN